jgi:hypothetical protein
MQANLKRHIEKRFPKNKIWYVKDCFHFMGVHRLNTPLLVDPEILSF